MSKYNQQYWNDRIERLTSTVYNEAEREAALFSFYTWAKTEVTALIGGLFARYASNGELTYQEMSKYNRLASAEKQIQAFITELWQQEQKAVTSLLTGVYEATEGYLHELYTEVGIESKFNKLNRKAIEKVILYPWSGDDFSNRLWSNKQLLISNLRQSLVRGFVQGQSIDKMTQSLLQNIETAEKNARRVIRTESAHVMNQAAMDSYEALELEKVTWITREDERTCDICGPLNNKVMTMERGMLRYDGELISNPAHPNCRCTIAPYSEGIAKYL